MNKLIVFIALLLLLVTSCRTTYYAPNSHNTPLISHKGEVNLSASIGSNSEANISELQIAIGLSEKYSAMLNLGMMSNNEESNFSGAINNRGSSQYIELGFGYYKKLTDKIHWETYALLGAASLRLDKRQNPLRYNFGRDLPVSRGSLSANLLRTGIQSNLGLKTKYLDLVLSNRLAHIKHFGIKGNMIYNDEPQVDYLKDHNSHFVIEPAITLRLGFKAVKLQLQTGISYNLTNPAFRQSSENVSIGLLWNIPDQKKNKLNFAL